jgi:hypothetical protein
MVKKISLSTITTFHSLLVIVTALLLCLPISAHAASGEPAPETSSAPETSAPPIEPELLSSFGTPVDILHGGFLKTSFIRNPYDSESHFTLRLSNFGAVSGCAQLQRGEGPTGAVNLNKDNTTIKYISDRMEVTLDVPELALKDYDPRYTNYDCEGSHLIVYADVHLDRDSLINKNIMKFAVKTPDVDFGVKDVDITKDRLILKSKNHNMPESWLTLWFFPKNTIKLNVSGVNSDINLIKEIRDFGIAHGLTPMEEVLKDYTLPHQANDYVYFVDSKQIFLRELSVENNNKQVGEIGITKTYHGPNGPQERIKPLPIFANLMLEQKVWK